MGGYSIWPGGAPPERCGRGHLLVEGNVLVGWLPCTVCPGTQEIRGHVWIECQVSWCRATWYDPPHDEALPATMW
jgi:hypothetical protein